jgi:hypothetical protein
MADRVNHTQPESEPSPEASVEQGRAYAAVSIQDRAAGLSSQEAAERLQREGPNTVAMAVSTDRATPSPHPDRWSIRPLLATAMSLAVLVLALSALVFWVGSSALRLGLAETQTLAFVWLVFSSQATIYLTRVRGHCWTFRPGRWVLMGTLIDGGIVAVLAMGAG